MIDWYILRLLYPNVYKLLEKRKSYSHEYLFQFCADYGLEIRHSNENDRNVFSINDKDVSARYYHDAKTMAIDVALMMIDYDIDNKKVRGRDKDVAERIDQ